MEEYIPNPYNGLQLGSFLILLFSRFWEWLTGNLPTAQLVSDELQVLTLSSISISGALVGTFLVLRRMAMFANALSHTILPGIIITYLIAQKFSSFEGQINPGLFFLASIVTAFLTAFLTEFLVNTLRLSTDVSTGLVFTSLFAFGVVLVTVLTHNAHIGTEVIMGNVDALQLTDLQLAWWIALLNGILILAFYKEYLITSFDSAFASAIGIRAYLYGYLIMAQIAMTAVSGFRATGVLMVLSFLTAPPLTARLFCHRLPNLLLLSLLIGVTSSVIAVGLTRHFLSSYGIALSTSGVTVCLLTTIFLLGAIVPKFR